MSSAFNIPAGFALVPLEPTDDMLRDMHEALGETGYRNGKLPAMWAAALRATPPVDAVPGEPVAHGELHPKTAYEFGRRMARYCESFNGQEWALSTIGNVDRQNLATALDNLTECSAMLMNQSDRLAASAVSRAGMEPVALDFDKLQGAIMNLREPRTSIHSGIAASVAYKLGCRDIRHAATGLVGEFAASIAPAAPAEAKDAVRAEPAALREALVELVACKDMNEKIAKFPSRWPFPTPETDEQEALRQEYAHRQPRAWDAARKALAAPSTLRQPEAAGEAEPSEMPHPVGTLRITHWPTGAEYNFDAAECVFDLVPGEHQVYVLPVAPDRAGVASLVASEDTKLLDWIERNVCDITRLGDSARTVRISWNNGADYAFVGPRYNATWREAIRAARASAGEAQS